MKISNEGLHKGNVCDCAANLKQTGIFGRNFSTIENSQIESLFRVMLLLGQEVVICLLNITAMVGDDFDPAYILLLTGCDCFLSGKMQTLNCSPF